VGFLNVFNHCAAASLLLIEDGRRLNA
jgi:hypothetical protein